MKAGDKKKAETSVNSTEELAIKEQDTSKKAEKIEAVKTSIVEPVVEEVNANPIPVEESVAEPATEKKDYECCPEFDPKSWDKKEISWKGKYFIKDTIISPFNVPLNFGKVMKKNYKKIEAAKAGTITPITLIDVMSPFHSHIYVDVTKPVVGCHDVKLTGNFMSMVFEGPYKNTRKFIKEMAQYMKLKGKKIKKNYFFYPMCPKCCKKYGKTYTVILSEF